jgi:hypothetical protein
MLQERGDLSGVPLAPPQKRTMGGNGAKATRRLSVFLDDETGKMTQSSPNNDLSAPIMFPVCRLTQRCPLIVD